MGNTMTTKISGVYCIRNLVNNKRYIGSSKNIEKRWKSHKRRLNNKTHCNLYLQREWDKYGSENFEFAILEECSISSLYKLEDHYVKLMKSLNRKKGYNLVKVLEPPTRGTRLSEEHRKKLSEAHKGYKPTEEQRRKMSESNIGKHKVSEEHRRKLSEANKGKVVSEETRRKLSIANTGHIKTEETRRKLREARIGKKASEETKKRMSEAQRGRKHSEETKIKIGKAGKGRKLSKEHYEKLQEAAKLYRMGIQRKAIIVKGS